eukprot:GHVU01038932.1.p2 GENE.GHVU01038932.1~~GHVU01038932.1.p2  ORF type:complete len:115 (-),score=29.84 GHVU01038932.1:308-652(-)
MPTVIAVARVLRRGLRVVSVRLPLLVFAAVVACLRHRVSFAAFGSIGSATVAPIAPTPDMRTDSSATPSLIIPIAAVLRTAAAAAAAAAVATTVIAIVAAAAAPSPRNSAAASG